MELLKFSVGDIVCSPSKDEIKFNLDNQGALLLIKLRAPTSKEKNAIKNGTAQFKLASKEGILFFLSRFGTMEWMDTPFNRGLSEYTLIKPQDEMGLLLSIYLIDAATGCLKAIRAIGLSTNFSNALLMAAFQQPHLGTLAEYNNLLGKVYRKYNTLDLVTDAFATN